MLWIYFVLNLFALGALFSNHRLASMVCFLAYTAINLCFLLRGQTTDLDAVLFIIMTLTTLAVFASITAHSRDQVLTHQKKRGSLFLLPWALVIATFFGHWFLVLHTDEVTTKHLSSSQLAFHDSETFIILAVVILWMVGKNIYDRR